MRGASFDVVVLSTANDEGVAVQGPKGWAHFSSFTHFAREGVVGTGGAGRSDNLQDPQLIDTVGGLTVQVRMVILEVQEQIRTAACGRKECRALSHQCCLGV